MEGQRHSSANLPPGKTRYKLYGGAGWAPGPVWKGAQNITPNGIRSSERPARLRHPDPTNSSNISFSLLLLLLHRQVSVITHYDLLRLNTNFEQNTLNIAWQNFWTEYQQTQTQYTTAHTHNTKVKKEIKR